MAGRNAFFPHVVATSLHKVWEISWKQSYKSQGERWDCIYMSGCLDMGQTNQGRVQNDMQGKRILSK